MEPGPSPSARAVSFREVWRELGNSLNTLSLQRRNDEDSSTRDSASRKSTLHQSPIPKTSLLDRNPQIVVGVLYRYVNLASGWRPRLFVLQNGVLKYFKIYGPTAVNVFLLLDSLRQQGEVFPIGAEVSVREVQDERALRRSSASTTSGAGASRIEPPPTPRAEVHMQVGSIRESNADGRKFYVHSGTTVLTLRSETQDDRMVWIEALRSAKGAWDGLTPTAAGAMARRHTITEGAPPPEITLHPPPAEVQSKLLGMSAGESTVSYISEVLESYCQQYRELSLAEDNKRRALMDVLYQLEDDKRRLETALVVEGRASAVTDQDEGGRNGSEGDDGAQSVGSGGGGGGLERLDSLAAVLQGVGEDEEDDDDEFFECDALSLRSASHSRSGSMTELAGFFDGMIAVEPQHQQQALPLAVAHTPGTAAGPSQKTDGASVPEKIADSAPQSALMSTSNALVPVPVPNEPEWLKSEGVPPSRRTHLPPPQQREKSISLWALIKEMVGKDLTRVCLPVYFNEPLSALEKTAEDLEYSELLDAAAALPPGSVDRMLKVAAFAISAYSSTLGRTAKPFNPLLGETYELVYPEKGFRFVAEKVSHHPTIIAAHAQGRGWTFEGDAEVKSKFWGRSIELKPEGVLRLTFDDGDCYAWNKVTTSINNLILGKIYIDHGGVMKVRCLRPGGLTARVRFKETGLLFDKDPRQVRGFLERQGTKLERPLLFGHWDDAVHAEMEDGRVVELWRKAPSPPDPTRYNLTSFAIQLNELTPGLKERVAPTDCRLRPDQAYTEQGMWDEANAEKQRLEHKQRAARKAADRGDPIKPRWFDVLPAGCLATGTAGAGGKPRAPHELAFQYKGGYWESRSEGDYVGCRDIFGPNIEE